MRIGEGVTLGVFLIFALTACGGGGGSTGGDTSIVGGTSNDGSDTGSGADSDDSDQPSDSGQDPPASDTDPDSFAFDPRDNAIVSSLVESGPVTITGIDSATQISVTGGEYSIDGAAFTTATGTVENNQRIVVRVTASADFITTTGATLSVGGVAATFSVTTGPEDTMPDGFLFARQSNLDLATLVVSESKVITGINGDVPVSITDGEYSIDGGAFVQDAGTVSNGQSIRVRRVSSPYSDTFATTTLTVGDFSTVWDTVTGRFYVSAGDYEALSNCVPYVGAPQAPIKLVFMEINDAPQFDAIVDDAINNQFATIPPFSEEFSSLAFYKLDLGDGASYDCRGTGTQTNGRGFECDYELINQEIVRQCGADDPNGVIKIAIAESQYTATATGIIWLPDNSLSFYNTTIHEVGHNLGLADLYGERFNFNGDPVQGWPPTFARQWLNLDEPGCPSWCDAFKPPNEYIESVSSACPTFTTQDECLAFNRPTSRDCEDVDGDGHFDCCTWSDTPSDDYFNTSCAPVWGVEDIGLSCLAGAGCYFGGAFGNNSWRPVRTNEDSLMYSLSAPGFDSVSDRALRRVFECCATEQDAELSCANFRSEFADFLIDISEKRRIGSCGVY